MGKAEFVEEKVPQSILRIKPQFSCVSPMSKWCSAVLFNFSNYP